MTQDPFCPGIASSSAGYIRQTTDHVAWWHVRTSLTHSVAVGDKAAIELTSASDDEIAM